MPLRVKPHMATICSAQLWSVSPRVASGANGANGQARSCSRIAGNVEQGVRTPVFGLLASCLNFGVQSIHAHHAHLLLALEIAQIRLQRCFAAAGYDVVDGVVVEIAERSREALATAEEML